MFFEHQSCRTVKAVYSTADKDSLHVRFADEAVCIGPPQSSDSYLKISNIIAAAETVKFIVEALGSEDELSVVWLQLIVNKQESMAMKSNTIIRFFFIPSYSNF